MAENELNESVNAEQEQQMGLVTDADLDAAFQEFIGIEEPEERAEPQNPEDTTVQQPPDNPSRLGRKVARMEERMVTKDDLTALNNKIDSLFEKLTVKEQPKPFIDEFGEPNEEPVDIDKKVNEAIVRREREDRERAEAEERAYIDNYVGQLKSLLEDVEDLDVAKEVYRKMITPGSKWNVKYSDNPFADVAKNFTRAMKDTKIKKPFDGNRSPQDVSTGVNTANSSTAVAKKIPKLDPVAEEYAKIMGMSEEDINEALNGELPASLSRRY